MISGNILLVRDRIVDELDDLYPSDEGLSIAYIIMDELAGVRKSDFAMWPGRELPVKICERLEKALQLLKENMPVQYVTGKAYFMGLEMAVNGHVLIPRPETEELVDWVIGENADKEGLRILDVGTGSGCIAVALFRYLASPDVTGIDISRHALEVAAVNAKKYKAPIGLLLADILDANTHPDLGEFDLIVSNPPYVRFLEKVLMARNVLEYEPSIALYVPDNDPLLYYRAIGESGRNVLKDDGKLYLEINEAMGREVEKLLRRQGYRNIRIMDDIRGKNRMVSAEK